MERIACIIDSCVPTHSRTESAPIPLVGGRRSLEDQRGHGFGAFGKAPACEGQVPGPRR
jgi:hypothetical protein